MRSAKEFLVIGMLLVPACAGGSADSTPSGQGGGSGTGGTSAVGGTGSGGTSAGVGGGAASGGLAGSGGTGANSGGAAGTGGTGAGGQAAGLGGRGGTGGIAGSSAGGGGSGTGSVGTQDPIIPPVSGTCPEFRSGMQTIMGLATQIVAGTPGATKGPLLFTWHGTNGSGTGALGQLPQSVQQDIVSQGGIVIAPTDNGQVREGTDVTLILGVWYDVGDLKYADQIVACAVQNHNIDPRRIYVTGCSAGGLMAGAMTLQRSKYVAACSAQFRRHRRDNRPASRSAARAGGVQHAWRHGRYGHRQLCRYDPQFPEHPETFRCVSGRVHAHGRPLRRSGEPARAGMAVHESTPVLDEAVAICRRPAGYFSDLLHDPKVGTRTELPP